MPQTFLQNSIDAFNRGIDAMYGQPAFNETDFGGVPVQPVTVNPSPVPTPTPTPTPAPQQTQPQPQPSYPGGNATTFGGFSAADLLPFYLLSQIYNNAAGGPLAGVQPTSVANNPEMGAPLGAPTPVAHNPEVGDWIGTPTFQDYGGGMTGYGVDYGAGASPVTQSMGIGGGGSGMSGANMGSSIIGGLGNAISAFAKNVPNFQYQAPNLPLPRLTPYTPAYLPPNTKASY